MSNSGGQETLWQLSLGPEFGEAFPVHRADRRAGVCDTPPADEGTLLYRGHQIRVRGRALELILWTVEHQKRINAIASSAGQLWLSWKGEGPRSIAGDIKTPL